MSDFKSRPFMAGNTDVFVMSQPFITGTEHLNSDARLDPIETIVADAIAAGTTPPTIELSIQTESGNINWQLDLNTASEADRTLAAIVSNINILFGPISISPRIQAFDFEGCLRIQSWRSGLVDTDGDGPRGSSPRKGAQCGEASSSWPASWPLLPRPVVATSPRMSSKIS